MLKVLCHMHAVYLLIVIYNSVLLMWKLLLTLVKKKTLKMM